MKLTPAALSLALLIAPGCFLRKNKPVPPPAQLPAPAPTTQPAKTQPLPAPPKVPAQNPPITQMPGPPQQPTVATPAPPPPKPARPKRERPAAAAPPVEPAPQPAQPVLPKIGQLLSPEEERYYAQDLERSLADAEAILAQVGGRALTAEQQTVVERIKAFVQQARDQRDSDLVTARSLARRADILAQDLIRGLR